MLQEISLHQESSWQETLSDLVTDPAELLALLELSPGDMGLAKQGQLDFPLRVPRPFLARMEVGNPQDPLLLQVWPQGDEDLEVPGFVADPLEEMDSQPVAGILHKYAGRLLLMPTSSCAIHCRYCFRRHFPYQASIPDRQAWQNSFDYLRQRDSIQEVILSGGDPLAVSDRHLDWLLGQLEGIAHVGTLRLHTRLPIMIPARVSAALCRRLAASRLRCVLVLHSNHARELDDAVAAACARLRDSGVILLNQSVLLRDINDNAEALSELSERLFDMGVLPYYLHLLDRTGGTAHFEVDEQRGLDLIEALRQQLPGYLVPKLVRETPGAAAKQPV